MTFDDEALKAAAKALYHNACVQRGLEEDWGTADIFFRESVTLGVTYAINEALASMKARGVDPCAEARSEERERCAKIADPFPLHIATGAIGPSDIEKQAHDIRLIIARNIRALEDEK